MVGFLSVLMGPGLVPSGSSGEANSTAAPTPTAANAPTPTAAFFHVQNPDFRSKSADFSFWLMPSAGRLGCETFLSVLPLVRSRLLMACQLDSIASRPPSGRIMPELPLNQLLRIFTWKEKAVSGV